jgi:hypothetical protein
LTATPTLPRRARAVHEPDRRCRPLRWRGR